MASPQHNLTFFDLVNLCDNVHLQRDQRGLFDLAFNNENLVPFYLTESTESPIIGLLRPDILESLKQENVRSQKNSSSVLWNLRLEDSEQSTLRQGFNGPWVSFRDWVDTPAKRTSALKELCERWRDTGLFPDVCGPTKWRSEMYPIYADPFGAHDYPSAEGRGNNLNYVFEMERSACALFGVVTYGVHMSVYDEKIEEDGLDSLHVWVPTRSFTKQTWPGYLDNTVAGGIPSGMSMHESMVKECMEEASLDPDLVRKYMRAVGSISYFIRTAAGWLQPEIEYVYDIRIPHDIDAQLFTPRPMDGEVESFEQVPHSKLLEQLRAGLFKPNCGLVIIDLFIRLGYITPDNEPDFMRIITKIHGRFDYEKW
ncbi:nudix hydrolase 20 [Crepidotus variabilis]|uniref:Nudix hydrolase 20 n=1 Tax=Crepidotus variabilis TaxID=179855 RepID=A0A9P6EKZ0_9AGAR|nr:nudix hydrolase 20 [Crepidotus variabilis]